MTWLQASILESTTWIRVDIFKILPQGSLFATGADSRIERKKRVIEKLEAFFDRFHTLG